MKKRSKYTHAMSFVFSVIVVLSPLSLVSQVTEPANDDRDNLINAAKELMEATRYCALITLDSSGHPQVRTMDPFLPDDNMVVWLGTNIHSRKVSEIRDDSRVTLYYEEPDGGGYAVIQGNAYLADDPENKEKYWKEEWEAFYPDKNSSFTLIKVIPKKLEIISYMHGITGSPTTWAVPAIEF